MAPRRKVAKSPGVSEGYDVKKMDSSAIARVVEFYMSRILHAICNFSKGGETLAALSMAHLVHNRRKVIATSREEAMTLLFHSYSHPQARLTVLKGMRIEHTLTLKVVNDELASAANLVGETPVHHRHVRTLLVDFMRFRSDVIDRYGPLINKRASAFLWMKRAQGILVDDDDARQNFTMAATRAIDKFHPTAGSLTTYIGHWLRDAGNSRYVVPTSEAFSLSRNARRKIHEGGPGSLLNNKSVPLDDLNPMDEPVANERVAKPDLSFLAVLHKTGRLDELVMGVVSVGITETLSGLEARR